MQWSPQELSQISGCQDGRPLSGICESLGCDYDHRRRVVAVSVYTCVCIPELALVWVGGVAFVICINGAVVD